ncbi:hypothetical protein ROHU_012945 [Labeo rohita]|uniref:Uncharacterized protein n=1 Tax=Labeo rohita TaxID=84645 RepID=A0A498LD65_LABRO|nr:hypothetical protein ROHU_012945 [Labeo rohita]
MRTESRWSVIGIDRTTGLNRSLRFHVQRTDVKETGRAFKRIMQMYHSVLIKGIGTLLEKLQVKVLFVEDRSNVR